MIFSRLKKRDISTYTHFLVTYFYRFILIVYPVPRPLLSPLLLFPLLILYCCSCLLYSLLPSLCFSFHTTTFFSSSFPSSISCATRFRLTVRFLGLRARLARWTSQSLLSFPSPSSKDYSLDEPQISPTSEEGGVRHGRFI